MSLSLHRYVPGLRPWLVVLAVAGSLAGHAADPVLLYPLPEPGAVGVSPRIPITFTIVDSVEGVVATVFLNNVPLTRGRTIRNENQVDFTLLPDLDRQVSTNEVRVEFINLIGTGTIYTNYWSFTTVVDPNFIGPRLSYRFESGDLTLSWSEEAFLLGYVLESSDSADLSSWNPVDGGGTTNSVTFPTGGTAAHYRLNSFPTLNPEP
ncbi:MAG: hypothetical protein RIS76_2439 [Verrucomicrobiota bacterium]